MGELGVGALVAVSLTAVAGLLLLRRGAIGDSGARGTLLRHMAVAGIAAALCAVMYLADYDGATPITLAIANGAMVCAPALIWVALTRVNERMPAAVHLALALSLLSALAVPFTDAVVSGTVKVAALLIVCTLGGIETFAAPASTLRGVRIIRTVMLGYAVFCGVRLSAAAVLGHGSVFVPWGAVTQITTLLGMVCIAAVGVGSWRMAAALDDDPPLRLSPARLRRWARERQSEGVELTVCTLSLPDLSLIRAAHGAARAESVEDALWRAARDTAPGDCPVARIGRGRFAVVLPTATASPERAAALRRRFDELTPLVAYEDLPDIEIRHAELTAEVGIDAVIGRARPSPQRGRVSRV